MPTLNDVDDIKLGDSQVTKVYLGSTEVWANFIPSADRYWVGGSGTWDATDTTHWSDTSGGAGGASAPTSHDNVVIDAASGSGNISMGGATAGLCRSLDFTGFTGNFGLSNGNSLHIGDAYGGSLTMSPSMTIGANYNCAILLESSSDNNGNGWPITTAGKTMPSMNFTNSSAKYVLQDDVLMDLDRNNKSASFDANSQVYTNDFNITCQIANISGIHAGSSTITIYGNQNGFSSFNSFADPGTSLLVVTDVAYRAIGTGTYYDLEFRSLTSIFDQGSITCRNFTLTGYPHKTGYMSFAGNVTCTGTFSASGNSVVNRWLFQSNTPGTQRTITAGTVVASNVDFQDIAGAGAITDNFNRADSNSTMGSPWVPNSGTWGISDNTAYCVSPTNQATTVIESGTSDCTITVTMSVAGDAGICFRSTDDNNNWVTSHNALWKRVGGSYNLMGSFGGTFADGDVMTVVLSGDDITVKQNGNTVITATDSFNSTATKHGLRAHATSLVRFDNFSIALPSTVLSDTWNLASITGKSGDALGNSGITFTPSATQTATGTASFTWSTHSWTSRVPLPQDDVVIPNAFVGGRTITADMPRLGKNINFTATGNPALALTGPSGNTLFGSLTLASGMTTAGTAITLSGRGSHTITTSGVTILGGVGLNAPGGIYDQQDTLTTANTQGLGISRGTWNSNDHTLNVGILSPTGSTDARSIQLGSSTVNLQYPNPGFIWNVGSTQGLTLDASQATIVMDSAQTGTRTFSPGGYRFGTLRYDIANSPGPLVIAGNNDFGTLDVGPGRTLQFTAGSTQNVDNWDVNGASNGYVRSNPVDVGVPISVPDSAALSITGDIDIRWRGSLASWSAGTQDLMVKSVSGNRSFYLRIEAGKIAFYISTTGSDLPGTSSSANVSFVAGQTGWVRATRRQSDGRVQFFTASGSIANPSTSDFTQLGTNQTLSSGSPIFDSTAQIEIGGTENGGQYTNTDQNIYRIQIYNGIAGTLAFDADFTTKAVGANTFTESSANAATVTVNGNLAQAGDGRVTINSTSSGTQATVSKSSGQVSVDYLSVKDIAATGGATWYAGNNSVDVSNNSGWIFTAPPWLSITNGLTGVFDPDTLPGRFSNGGAVDSFYDASTAGYNLVAAGSTKPLLTYNYLNGHAVLDFDGTDDRMYRVNTPISTAGHWTCFAVAKTDAWDNGDNYIVGNSNHPFAFGDGMVITGGTTFGGVGGVRNNLDSGVTDYQGGTINLNEWHVYESVRSGGTLEMIMDGVSDGSTSGTDAVTASNAPLSIGGRGDETFPSRDHNGQIALVVIYNRTLSVGERDTVRQEIADRFGL